MGKLTPEAFLSLKEVLVSDAILMVPNFGESFTLQTDTSELGVGRVLSQQDEKGRVHLIAYHSKKLVPHKKNYPVIEKECLAIVEGI